MLSLCTLARSEAPTTAACAVAVFCLLRYRDGLRGLLFAPALLLLATGIRSPLLPALLVGTGYVWWRARASTRERAVAGGLLLAMLVLISVPVLLSTDRVVFQLWSSQIHRSLQWAAPEAASATIRTRIVLIYFVYMPFVILITAMLVLLGYAAHEYLRGWRPQWRAPEHDQLWCYVMITAFALLLFVPFLLAWPFEPRYFVPTSALITVPIAAAAGDASLRSRSRPLGSFVSATVVAVAIVTAPLYALTPQGATVPRGPVAQLRGADEIVASNMGRGDLLLTLDPLLTMQAGVKVMPGLEMGQFSYWPTMSDSDAAANGVFNRRRLTTAIGNGTPKVIALTNMDLAFIIGRTLPPPPPIPIKTELEQEAARVLPSLVLHYKVQDVLLDYGQMHEVLYILVRKE